MSNKDFQRGLNAGVDYARHLMSLNEGIGAKREMLLDSVQSCLGHASSLVPESYFNGWVCGACDEWKALEIVAGSPC